MTTDKSTHVVRLSKQEMQAMFNSNNLMNRKEMGEFSADMIDSHHARPEHSGQPFCTYSQMIGYLDIQNNQVAKVHRYLKPDGSIGGSGQEDPVRLFLNGITYKLAKLR